MPHVTSKDGTRIGYDMAGSGPAVILVAGATQYRAIDRNITPALQRLLARQFTVINFDRRGRGESGDTLPYEGAREVEDIAALIEMAGGEAYVFGMSSGAVLALEAAAAMPRQVKAVALYEPPIDPSRTSQSYRDEHEKMARLAAEGRGSDMLSDFLSGVGMGPETLAGFKASPAWPAFAAVGLTLEHDYRLLADARSSDRPPERWQNAIMPVLILDGDQSFSFMGPGADWVAGGLHNAQRVTLAGQGHEYDPEKLAPLLTVFFERGSVQVH